MIALLSTLFSRFRPDRLSQLEKQVNALQAAVAKLKTDVAALQAAVQANTFTAADVADIQALDSQVTALTASLTPPAPPAGS